MSNNNTSLTSSVIIKHIICNIKDNPEFKIKIIISCAKKILKVDVSYKKKPVMSDAKLLSLYLGLGKTTLPNY